MRFTFKHQFSLLLLLGIFFSVFIISACAGGAQPAAAPTPTSQITPQAQNTPIPVDTGPVTVDLISLTPVKSYGSVLAFGEEDVIRQQFGNFRIHNGYYPKSIFAPAPSVLEYQLNGQYDSFQTTIMMEDCTASTYDGSFFVIELDGEVAYRSPQMFSVFDPLEVKLGVSGVQTLRMEVYSTKNIGASDPNGDCDAPVWGDPFLTIEHPVSKAPVIEQIIAPTLETSLKPGDVMASFYVSLDGSDINPGTKELPFATLEHARDVIRTINQNMSGPINVYITGGTYQVTKTIEFTRQDSGTNGYDIVYQAMSAESPLISGGVEFSGWQAVAGQPYWRMQLPDTINPFRNLYVNGQRAVRAQTEGTVLGIDYWKGDWSDRDGLILSTAPGWWLKEDPKYTSLKNVMNTADLPTFSRPQDLELHWNLQWIDIRSRVEDVTHTDDGKIVIKMYQPYFSWAQNLRYIGWASWPAAGGNEYNPVWNKPFIIENALELMNQPGEWYYNRDTHELFYYPRTGEDMQTTKAVVPQLEVLMSVKGEGIGKEVHNLQFKGLGFAYSSWMRTSIYGTANQFSEELADGECALFCSENSAALDFTPSAVHLDDADAILFSGNTFRHIGSVALGMNNNVYNVKVIGNLFNDISDAAITMGYGEQQAVLDKPWKAVVHDILINNNLVNKSGVEYWGAHSIIGYYVQSVEVSHNQVQEVPNSGISLYGSLLTLATNTNNGDANKILNNKVDRASLRGDISEMILGGSDAGGIYLGRMQSPVLVEGNFVSNIVHNYGCFYLDLTNEDLTLTHNVCQNAALWLPAGITDGKITGKNILVQETYTNQSKAINLNTPLFLTEANPYNDDSQNIHILDTHYIPDANWPAPAFEIISNAGLEKEYQYLLKNIQE